MKTSSTIHLLISFVLTATAATTSATAAPLSLNPQFVVERVLREGSEARQIDLRAQGADVTYHRSLAPLDWRLRAQASHDFTRNEQLSGFQNPEDRLTTWRFGTEKKFSSGTTFNLDYSRTFQNSILSPLVASLRRSSQVQDYFELGIRQDLLANFLGKSDRARIEAASLERDRASSARLEQLEGLVLDSVRLYWNVYAARENLRQAMAARDKYSLLLKVVEGKQRSGLGDSSDVAKARAQFEGQDRNVKQASLAYLDLLEQLFLAMRMDPVQDVELAAPESLLSTPDLPQIPEAGLRAIREVELAQEAADASSRAARWNTLPELGLSAKTAFTGLDRDAASSFSEMTSGNFPRYLVTLDLTWRLGSNATMAELAQSRITLEQATVQQQRTRDRVREGLRAVAREVKAKYMIAQAAIESQSQWDKAVREQERKFRNGRISTFEMIQDYESLFRAEAGKSAAIADYNFSLHELEAARDRLVPNQEIER